LIPLSGTHARRLLASFLVLNSTLYLSVSLAFIDSATTTSSP
jgi:hypothetical protein